MERNHYKLNENVTVEKLKEAGFKEGGWMSNIKGPKLAYMRPLIDEIELNIEINTDTLEFDENENIFIFDDTFGQAYFPFYNEDTTIEFAVKVKRDYNKRMDALAEEGIFTKVNEKVKKKVK